jgi:RND superfamily putative drug exporter
MTGHDYGRLGRLGALMHCRRRRVVLAWVAALAAVIALAPLLKGDSDADFSTKGSQSARAETALTERFARRAADTDTVVWKADQGAQSPAIRARVDLFAELF